jgi:YVTN family beta-propeller protein
MLFAVSSLLVHSPPQAFAEEEGVIATISVGDSPNEIAFDSENNRMYVTNYNDDTVSVINTATNSVIATVFIGNTPNGIAFDSENNRMYYSLGNWLADATKRIRFIDTADHSVSANIATAEPIANGIAFDSKNDRMYVVNWNGWGRVDVPAPDNASVSVINTANNSEIATITVGDYSYEIAFDSANDRMYVTNYADDTVSVISTATNSVIATVSVGDSPLGMAFDSANNRMYVANLVDDTVSVINTATNAVDATISVGTNPYGIAFDSANNRMYVTNQSDDTVSVIDTATNSVIDTIPVGDTPHGIAFDPVNNRMYVTNRVDDTVSVIGTLTDTDTEKKSSSDCYDCEAPKLTKVELHISSSPFDYVWNFPIDDPLSMRYDNITPITANPGDEIEITLDVIDDKSVHLLPTSGIYTNFMERPNDMNLFFVNNFDENHNTSTSFYEWNRNYDDVAYDYADSVTWSSPEISYVESPVTTQTPFELLNDELVIEHFIISFKMKFDDPMSPSQVWVSAADYYGQTFKVPLPLTLEILGDEPIDFTLNLNQKVLGYFNEPVLLSMLNEWNQSSQDVSELSSILGVDGELPQWVVPLAIWTAEGKITPAEMIIAIEILINQYSE